MTPLYSPAASLSCSTIHGMERRVAVRGLIIHDGKLLCARLTAYNGVDHDYWCTPGGGLDIGESLKAGLKREIIEETGITPKIGRLRYIQQYAPKQKSQREEMELFFIIDNPRDFLNIDLAQTTHGQHEIERIDFVDPAKENVLPNFLKNESIEEILNGDGVKLFNYLP